MRIYSEYELGAVDDIQSALYHYLLRDDAEHCRQAIFPLSRAVEALLREKLCVLGDPQHKDLGSLSEILDHLQTRGVSLPVDLLLDFGYLRNRCRHRSTWPTTSEVEEVAEPVFCFVRGFMEVELRIALEDAFDYYHAALLRGETRGPYEKAKVLSIAASRVVHGNPRHAQRLAGRAVDWAIRALAVSCGIQHDGKTFVEVVEALYEVDDPQLNSVPYYPVGEDYVRMEASFLRYPPISDEGDPIEAFVLLARQTVVAVLSQVERPEWQAAVRHKWNDVVDVLARESPATHAAVEGLEVDSVSVHGDCISISFFGRGGDAASWRRGRSELVMEDCIQRVVPRLPPDFRVRAWGIGLGRSDDDRSARPS